MMVRFALQVCRLFLVCLFSISVALAEPVSEERIRSEVIAPYSLGEKTETEGVWELLNGSGAQGGYVIETEWIKPLPGFAGEPINLIILLDTDGIIIDVKLLNHNEPIFVSGLGEAPFRAFIKQYRGQSINSPITVGSAYGNSASSGSLIYFDGVTKATASVRIAHESILSSARDVAKSMLSGFSAIQEKVSVKEDEGKSFTWDELVSQGFATHFTATHGEIRALFADTTWRSDDRFPDAADDDLYVDMWVVDTTHVHVARSVMTNRMLRDWESLKKISPDYETILLIEKGNHGLVTDEFVRNTAPPLITATQDGFPLSIRDADLLLDFKDDVPEGASLVVRLDRRQGFSPVREWDLGLIATRQRGILKAEVGEAKLSWKYQTDRQFFNIEKPLTPPTPFEAAVFSRMNDLFILAGLLTVICLVVLFNRQFVQMRSWPYQRAALMIAVLGFIGWWGQGQLSIVTLLAALTSAVNGKPLDFLLYDPFSLLIWVVVIVSFFFVGRALFCGWLCPFGALQELVAKLAKVLSIRQLKVSDEWDARLKYVKYIALLGLVGVAFFLPRELDTAAEVEPFKTAISVFFVREWYYAAYALICVFASAVVFKGYCRYLCPLGAFMAVAGFLRLSQWIKRREDCGSPCQLCNVRCEYKAIKRTGEITYSECFGCLDCVDIYEDKSKCVPLILEEKAKLKSAINKCNGVKEITFKPQD